MFWSDICSLSGCSLKDFKPDLRAAAAVWLWINWRIPRSENLHVLENVFSTCCLAVCPRAASRSAEGCRDVFMSGDSCRGVFPLGWFCRNSTVKTLQLMIVSSINRFMFLQESVKKRSLKMLENYNEEKQQSSYIWAAGALKSFGTFAWNKR